MIFIILLIAVIAVIACLCFMDYFDNLSKNCDRALMVLPLLNGKYLGAWNQYEFIEDLRRSKLPIEEYVKLFKESFGTEKEFHTLPKDKRKYFTPEEKFNLCYKIIDEFKKSGTIEAFESWSVSKFIEDKDFDDMTEEDVEGYVKTYLNKFRINGEFHTK